MEGLTLSASGGRGICEALLDVDLEMNTGLEDFEVHHENVSESAVGSVKLIRYGRGRDP
jgi:hypothetical protein